MVKRLTIRIPDELHQQIKIKCAVETRTIEGALTELLQDWVGANQPPLPRVILPPTEETYGL